MSLLERKTNKTIEYFFYNYFNIRRELQEAREEILEGSTSFDYESIPAVTNNIADTTGKKVIELCRYEEKEKWCTIVEKTLKKFTGTGKDRLIEKKYFEELGEVHICQLINVERATYYNWKNEIIYYAALLAAKDNLIKV